MGTTPPGFGDMNFLAVRTCIRAGIVLAEGVAWATGARPDDSYGAA